MKFTLEFKLTDDISSGTDIAYLLRKTAETIDSVYILNNDVPVCEWDQYDRKAHIYDKNHTIVGTWKIVQELEVMPSLSTVCNQETGA